MAAEALPPASGAWHPGLPPARRRFFELSPQRPFGLEGGGLLHQPVLAFETWGELDATASNAILVCHALTGDAHAHGPSDPPGQLTEGWWNDFIGPGRPLDTDRYFVVCANNLGGCQGSTGPSSTDPATGRRYCAGFPVVTIRDIVRSQAALGEHLGVHRWAAVVGGSMGGMQSLEWAVTHPDRVAATVVIAACAAATAQQIAWSSAGRHAIVDDPGFAGGDYYDAPAGAGPHRGLANARRIAMIHYRSADEFDRRFDRQSEEALAPFRMGQRFDVERYLDYHGDKICDRFDANTYLVLNKCMDLHDIGRGRGGVDGALARIRSATMVMSVNSDFLYPRAQQMRIVDALADQVTVEHVDIDSDNGHDAFLTEPHQSGPPMGRFIDEVAKAQKRASGRGAGSARR
ncbi:MAG TPA: homoserine O-acetyltransferase [Acidimicrobiaceae bacterium]|nr:homoserine O-acetyltransferase [Acidimicrobiaceae bacterium]